MVVDFLEMVPDGGYRRSGGVFFPLFTGGVFFPLFSNSFGRKIVNVESLVKIVWNYFTDVIDRFNSLCSDKLSIDLSGTN